jgi:hypothetical protein
VLAFAFRIPERAVAHCVRSAWANASDSGWAAAAAAVEVAAGVGVAAVLETDGIDAGLVSRRVRIKCRLG